MKEKRADVVVRISVDLRLKSVPPTPLYIFLGRTRWIVFQTIGGDRVFYLVTRRKL